MKDGDVASEPVRRAVRQLIDAVGTAKAAKTLGLGRETLARVVAGLVVRRGTLSLLRERLATKGA